MAQNIAIFKTRHRRLLRSMQAAEEETARAIAAGWRASQHELLARRRAQRLAREQVEEFERERALALAGAGVEPQHGEKVYDVAIWLKPEDDEVVVLGPDGEAVAEEAEGDAEEEEDAEEYEYVSGSESESK